MSETWTLLKAKLKTYFDTLYDATGAAAGILSTSITDNDTTHAPNGNAVFDALAGKAATSQKLDDFGTPDDNTDLNATTSAHGLLLKATAPASGLRNVVAIDNAETAYTNKALFDATSPSTQAFGDSAVVGTAMTAARRDHKHAMMASPTIPVKATGAEITTGTDDAKFATPKALSDAGINNTINAIRGSLFTGLTDQYLPYFNSGEPQGTLVNSPAYVDGSGNLVIASKNIVMSSGYGMDFSATANSSGTMTGELLDDYERGSFTPGITFGGSSTGITYSVRQGYYIKVGSFCYFTLEIVLSNNGSGTGDALVTGLPFTSNSAAYNYGAVSFAYTYTTTYTGMLQGYVNSNATTIQVLYGTEGGTTTNLTHSNVPDTGTMVISGGYFTA